MCCFVILLLSNEMQMSVRRFSAIPHLREQLRMRRNCHATLGTRFQVCLFQVYFVGRFFCPDDFLYIWKGDVLGGSVLVEEHYIICFQIIGSLAPNIAECFPAHADWFYLKQIHRHFAQNGDWCFFYTLGTKIVLIFARQAAFCTCFDLSSAWRAYLNSVKTELISKCLQTFAAFVHKYHVFESGGGLWLTVYTTVQLFTCQRFLI